jgi:hypothetical protein
MLNPDKHHQVEGNLDEFAAALCLGAVVKRRYRSGFELHSTDDWKDLGTFIIALASLMSELRHETSAAHLSPLYRHDPPQEVGKHLMSALVGRLSEDRRHQHDEMVSVRSPPGGSPDG